MNNKILMEKVIELDTQVLKTREQSRRVMVQIAIIRKAFGVKNSETVAPVKEYERSRVLSDQEVKKEFETYVNFYNWANAKNDNDKAVHFKSDVYNFIDAVAFFDKNLASELKESFENIAAIA